jgi:gliding motility-associated-like protein
MKTALFSLVLLLAASSGLAQSTTGTSFWLGYMENLNLLFNDAPTFTIWVDADVTTDGTINVPATGLSIPFTAPGGSITAVDLPTAIWYSEGSELVENKGIQILTDEPVRVTGLHYRIFFTESSIVLPETELGIDYFISSYLDEQGDASSPTSFVVVSTSDSTVVEITPTALTQGLQPPGLPFTVVLNEGQNFQVKSLGELMGTRVRSLTGESIAVFSGAQQGNIGDCLGAADSHVWDQALPIDSWGTNYFFVPFLDQGGDEVRIMAAQDNTTVFLDCASFATLDAGEWVQVKLFGPTIVNADKPISLAHFASSADCTATGLGDPNLLMEWPLERRTRKARFIATNGPAPSIDYFTDHFFNIVTASGSEGLIELDGNPLGATFSPFPADPNWVYAQVEVAEGPHFLESDSLFYAYSYGFAQFDAYTHHLGYSEQEEVVFECLELLVDGVLCVDSTLSFSTTGNLPIQSYSWNLGPAGTSTDPMPSVTFTTPGTYTIELTATLEGGGQVLESLDVTIVDCPPDPCSGEPNIVIEASGNPCLELVTFSFTADSTFTSVNWDLGNGVTSTEFNPSAGYSVQGVYQITLTAFDALNCPYEATFDLVVPDCGDPCNTLTPPIITFEEPVCVGIPTIFFGEVDLSSPGNFPTFLEWVFSDGQTSSELNPEITFNTPGVYSVALVVEYSLGCAIETQFDFEVLADCGDPCVGLSEVLIFQDPNPACAGSLVSYFAQTDAVLVDYSWDFGNGDTSNDEIGTTVFDNPGNYFINLVATDTAGCVYEEEVLIFIQDCGPGPCDSLPPVTITTEGPLCVGDAITVFLETDASIEQFNWTLQGELLSNDAASFVFLADSVGSYEVSFFGIDGNTCPYSAQATLQVGECDEPCPEIDAVELTLEGSLCTDSLLVVTYSFERSLENILWNGPNLLSSSANQAIISAPLAGQFSVIFEATDSVGCFYQSVEEYLIEDCGLDEDCGLYFPNIFTPDGDGTNDGFRPLYACPPRDFFMQIYNRWGGLVYESRDPAQAWDGRLNGKPMPSDVYVYRVVYTQADGIEPTTTYGDITLVR